jgi:uncharacterized protein (DUF1697 family)
MATYVALLRGVNIGKAGRAATTRNWATVLKLHALALSIGA